ncbi:hypothetical protein [Methanobrevibacter sp.]|uniref:hypothetical protein n=1 Tax=Methanobrevibacter sp. TaxID=66852 RepID=UPI0025E9A8D3|nr:hypothetical protein [Methanobrevibacter sp.]MBQ2961791.1 hypothetical protein [Methanobrevibacter sp.]
MYKKLFALLILSFLVIGAASASDFKINDGFEDVTEYFSVNDETGMTICTWENDEYVQEYYLQNGTDYSIVEGDNNTYNITENTESEIGNALSYLTSGKAGLTYGVLEEVEFEGKEYVIYTYIENTTPDDWKACYDELMKFNENNNLEPIADAI